MKSFKPQLNQSFTGRSKEIEQCNQFAQLTEAAIMVVYGRRRVGKTELIEHCFQNRLLLKFEGLENSPQQEQIEHVLYQASIYFEDPIIARLNFTNWVEVLDFIAAQIADEEVTLYFEELQWLANYENKLISALKYVWDNNLRRNPKLRLILCGSSPSFMINQVINSQALYNRSLYKLHLQAFSIAETKEFLPDISKHEVIQAYLSVGGIPEYLKYLKKSSSVFIGVCEHSFKRNGFLNSEYERIFISSLKNNPHYQKIIRFLSHRRYASRNEIAQHLGIKSGGSMTNLIQDLEQCEFIQQYKPFYLDSGRGIYRYCISDPYLMFYYKFIEPVKEGIFSGKYEENPTSAINLNSYHTWMGFAFERLIRANQHLIAKILGFSGLPYRSGVYYSKQTMQAQPGYQIDLLFEHSKHVYTICEVKYHSDLVGPEVISELQEKLNLFPNDRKHTIKKVLITNYGVKDSVIQKAYFDRIITLDDLLVD